MKKIISFAVGLIIIVAVFLGYQKFSKPAQVLSVDTIYTKQEQVILLYPESGDVTFKVTPDGVFQEATTSPTIIPNQAIIHTGTGTASVLLPDNSSISLDNDTEITINYVENKTSIYQSLGTTYHRVEKLLTGATYQVQTAGTLAAVRGTKFAVRYDIQNKKTKIAVTESKVEVATVSKSIDTTAAPYNEESILLEAGKTVSVETLARVASRRTSAMHIVDTVDDADMHAFVEKEKGVDRELEILKKDITNQGNFRKEMKRKLFNDEDTGTPRSFEKKTKENDGQNKDIQDSTATKKEDAVTSTDKPKENKTLPVVKMDEQKFFTEFEALFIKYFYIDNSDDVICTVQATPEERVKIVTSFAELNGYPFVKTTLLSFAEDIDAYCRTKDKDTKVKLQTRFDNEYPF